MGLIADSLADFTQILVTAGLPVVSDPRNLQPPAVLVDLPSIESQTGTVIRMTIPVVCVAPPPGNLDSLNRLLELMDDVYDAFETQSVYTLNAEPGLYQIGQMELPSYSIRVTASYMKEP